jgi:hypothetical protein
MQIFEEIEAARQAAARRKAEERERQEIEEEEHQPGTDPELFEGECVGLVSTPNLIGWEGIVVFTMKVACDIPMKEIDVEVCGQEFANEKWGSISCEPNVEKSDLSPNPFKLNIIHDASAEAVAKCTPGDMMRTWGWFWGWGLPPWGPPGEGVPYGLSSTVKCPKLQS